MHFQIHRSALKLSITITCKAAAPTFTVELWRLVKLQNWMLTHVDTLPMWRVYRTLASCRCRKFCLRACISRTEMYRNAIIICNYWFIISYIIYIYYCILWLTYHINDHVLQMSWRLAPASCRGARGCLPSVATHGNMTVEAELGTTWDLILR